MKLVPKTHAPRGFIKSVVNVLSHQLRVNKMSVEYPPRDIKRPGRLY